MLTFIQEVDHSRHEFAVELTKVRKRLNLLRTVVKTDDTVLGRKLIGELVDQQVQKVVALRHEHGPYLVKPENPVSIQFHIDEITKTIVDMGKVDTSRLPCGDQDYLADIIIEASRVKKELNKLMEIHNV